MREEFSIASHRGRTAIEDGGGKDIRGVQCPIPIGLSALVSALGSKSLLVQPDKVAVPCEQVSVEMDLVAFN